MLLNMLCVNLLAPKILMWALDLWKICVILAGDEIEKNEMGGACIDFGGGERLVQDFGGET
jgi:hypothetical protein